MSFYVLYKKQGYEKYLKPSKQNFSRRALNIIDKFIFIREKFENFWLSFLEIVLFPWKKKRI